VSILALVLGFALAPAVADTSWHLVLQVPAYRLDLMRGDRVARSIRVAIGMREHPTPLGRFTVNSVTWNPWWYPPKSAWAAHDTITPPCPANPVGRVKLGFGSLLYIHGTPASRSIGRPASHGCVRVTQNDALALADDLVRAVLPESAQAAARYAAGSATHRMDLPALVPLEIRYDLAEVLGDTLWLYPDVYRRNPATARRMQLARRALAAAGRDSLAFSDGQLRSLVAASRRARTPAAIP